MSVAIVSDAAGLILLLAFVAKLADHRRFVESVRGYELLPQGLVLPAAAALMAAELLLGISLVAHVAPRIVLVASGALFSLFALGGLLVVRRRPSDEVDCGCLGPLAHLRLSRVSAAINGIVAATCIGAAVPDSQRVDITGATTAVLLALLLALTYWLSLYAASVLAHVGGIVKGGSSR